MYVWFLLCIIINFMYSQLHLICHGHLLLGGQQDVTALSTAFVMTLSPIGYDLVDRLTGVGLSEVDCT